MDLKKILLLLLFITSCSSIDIGVPINCNIKNNGVELKILNDSLDDVEKKQLVNRILNYNNIIYNPSSEYIVNLNVEIKKNISLISSRTLETNLERVKYVTYYSIENKITNEIVRKGKIILSDNMPVINERFVNFQFEHYMTNNFLERLANKIEAILSNCQ